MIRFLSVIMPIRCHFLLSIVTFALSLALLSASEIPADDVTFPLADENSPIFAVGDIHGDLASFLAVLRRCSLIPSAWESGDRYVWTGGRSTLVQTGDVWDRGIHGAAVHQFLEGLAPVAAAAGGLVVRLLGNHELLNLNGQALQHGSYVKREELALLLQWLARQPHDSVLT